MKFLGKDREALRQQILRNWDNLAKPLDGLGLLEQMIARIGSVQGRELPSLSGRTLLVFLADNGITEEGVSQSTWEVTHRVGEAMAEGRSTVCVMAARAGVRVHPVDIGMRGSKICGLEDRRIREGSRSFARESAMTPEEASAAMDVGAELAERIQSEGADLLLLGEMGIGNTSTATAVACALRGDDPAQFAGPGAGLTDAGLQKKRRVLTKALSDRKHDREDPFGILCSFGGYDIAGMAGAIRACGRLGLPVVLDGLVTLAAALVAERLFPGCTEVCLASHRPREPMGQRILEELGLHPPIDAGMSLGEGTGGVLLVPLLDVALALYAGGERFQGIGLEPYQRGDR